MRNTILLLLLFSSFHSFAQIEGKLIDFVGVWERYEYEYQNSGYIERYGPSAAHIKLVISIDPGGGTVLKISQYINGELTTMDNWRLWLNPYTKGFCTAPKYNASLPGEKWKFYYDNRGIKSFAAQGYRNSQKAWVRYRRMN